MSEVDFGLPVEQWDDLYELFREVVDKYDFTYDDAILYFDTTKESFSDFLILLERYEWFDYRNMDKIYLELSLMIDELIDDTIIISNTVMLNPMHVEQLLMIPEEGSGYHIVDIVLIDGTILKNKLVLNFNELLLDENDPNISSSDILKIIKV